MNAIGANVRLEDVPLKVLRAFCVAQKYGIKGLSVSTKGDLLPRLRQADTSALEHLSAWLDARNRGRERIYVEALSRGRRITQERVNGECAYRRVFEEKR